MAERYAADFADELTRKPWDVERLRAFAAAGGAGLVLDVGCGAAGHVGRFVADLGARVGEVTSVTMETRKPPRGLAGAPFIEQQKIDLDAITTETVIFEGPATEACRAFPANVNVLAALSLAGIGPERTRIKIYAVPGLTRNVHRVTIQGEFGRLTVEIENVPSENPRTGKLSYLSTIALLRDLGAPIRVGT